MAAVRKRKKPTRHTYSPLSGLDKIVQNAGLMHGNEVRLTAAEYAAAVKSYGLKESTVRPRPRKSGGYVYIDRSAVGEGMHGSFSVGTTFGLLYAMW